MKLFKNLVGQAKKLPARLMKDNFGGVSPMVVTIGLALLLLVILAAINPTIKSGVSTAVNTVITRLQSF